ncbi:MAG: 2Fe-2S iron-sulfur cluster binding domain-containing protein, partial [Chloroflexi bacterium]
MPDVNLTIDGHKIAVPAGTLVVEAAKTIGIEIPVFCYHHKLDPVGACRLCLVEMTPGPPRPQTACTTPVAEGMVVKTQTAMAVQARADILEFELANHPLDCPVCDKGGECPLQDFTFRHGYPTSRIDGPRLHFKKPIPLSDKIALDRERCVLCYRCTRYYDEIAWEQELTTDERGVQSFITSQFEQPLKSIFSGNIIDLCPVGALTSRVWRFESRPWDMTHTASVCSKCAVGCSVTLWQRRGQLVRVTSHENDDIDEGWICDRGRFDYTDVNDPSRLRTPTIKGARATWADAINALAAGIKGKGAKLGVSLPQDITNEEAFLFRKLLDGPLKGAKVKMHGRTAIPGPANGARRAQGAVPEGLMRIREIDDARVIVVVASDLEHDVPIVDLRVKKAISKRGAKLIVVYPDSVDLDRHPGTVHIRNAPGSAAAEVRKLASHELLRDPGGPVAILFGDGYGGEDIDDLASACGDLARKV